MRWDSCGCWPACELCARIPTMCLTRLTDHSGSGFHMAGSPGTTFWCYLVLSVYLGVQLFADMHTIYSHLQVTIKVMLTFNLAAVDLCRWNFRFQFSFFVALSWISSLRFFFFFGPDLVLGPVQLRNYYYRFFFWRSLFSGCFSTCAVLSGATKIGTKNCLPVIYGAEFVLTWQCSSGSSESSSPGSKAL